MCFLTYTHNYAARARLFLGLKTYTGYLCAATAALRKSFCVYDKLRASFTRQNSSLFLLPANKKGTKILQTRRHTLRERFKRDENS